MPSARLFRSLDPQIFSSLQHENVSYQHYKILSFESFHSLIYHPPSTIFTSVTTLPFKHKTIYKSNKESRAMVYYYRSTGSDASFESNPRFVYMGKDSAENDDLITFGFDEDVWFHADTLSSAHVYLRLQRGENWESIPEALLEDCAQLCKANSIQGNKRNNITIVYTPWSNLKKSKGMASGQVGFKNQKKVRKYHVQLKDNAILNRLKKTREELVNRNLLMSARNSRDPDAVIRALAVKREAKAEEEAERKRLAADKKRNKMIANGEISDDEDGE